MPSRFGDRYRVPQQSHWFVGEASSLESGRWVEDIVLFTFEIAGQYQTAWACLGLKARLPASHSHAVSIMYPRTVSYECSYAFERFLSCHPRDRYQTHHRIPNCAQSMPVREALLASTNSIRLGASVQGREQHLDDRRKRDNFHANLTGHRQFHSFTLKGDEVPGFGDLQSTKRGV